MQDKEMKIQILADKLNTILPLIDAYINNLNEEEFELLIESREALADKISRNNNALPVIFACGGYYDDTEDRLKIRTLNCLIDLIEIREEYKEEKIKIQKEQENKAEVLKLFGIMGM